MNPTSTGKLPPDKNLQTKKEKVNFLKFLLKSAKDKKVAILFGGFFLLAGFIWHYLAQPFYPWITPAAYTIGATLILGTFPWTLIEYLRARAQESFEPNRLCPACEKMTVKFTGVSGEKLKGPYAWMGGRISGERRNFKCGSCGYEFDESIGRL